MTQEWDADKGRGGFSLRFLTDSLGTNTVKDIRSNLRSLDDNSNFFRLKEKQSFILVTIIFPKVKKKVCSSVSQLDLSYGIRGRSLELCSSLDRCALCHGILTVKRIIKFCLILKMRKLRHRGRN